MGSGKYRVYRGDKYRDYEEKVIQLYQDYQVRKAAESAIHDVLGENGISKIAFTRDKGETFEEVDASKKEYFAAPPEAEAIVDEQTFETNVHLVRLSFNEGNKWTVDDGIAQYSASVEDEDYMSRVERNEIDFSKGDVLKVRMRYVQYSTSSGLKKEYFIEKVIEHSKAKPSIQIELDVDDKEGQSI